jgi:hypothetical protein
LQTSVSGAALAAASLFSSFASAVQNLNVNGANFITKSSGNRFSIVGVDYQPGGSSGVTATSDPLTDATACLRDAILMQRLGVNTVRVYNLIPSLNHDECASIFNAAGIYLLLDVNNGNQNSYIDRVAPWTTYTNAYLTHVFGVIEAFAPYPNLLGFFSGNEIINEASARMAPAYIRAVTRDMKDYIAKNIARPIPVGYSAADVATMLSDTWEYLGCELANSTSSKIDFFGLNDYGKLHFWSKTTRRLTISPKNGVVRAVSKCLATMPLSSNLAAPVSPSSSPSMAATRSSLAPLPTFPSCTVTR